MPAQASNDFGRLYQEQLAELLSHVPLQQRMSACSLVHSSWRAAANLTVAGSICCTNRRSLTAWLQAHAQHVPVKAISVRHRPCFEGELLLLPAAQLQTLQSLSLHRVPWALSSSAAAAAAPQTPARILTRSRLARQQEGQQGAAADAKAAASNSAVAPAWQDLAALPSLTSLTLVGSSVRLGGLAALTGLRELSTKGTAGFGGAWDPSDVGMDPEILSPEYVAETLDGMNPDESIPELPRNQATLASALPKLRALTSLQLKGDVAGKSVVAVLGRLTQLQQLRLLKARLHKLPSLPRSLTQLDLGFARQDLDRAGAAGTGSNSSNPITSSVQAVLGQLSVLQLLRLQQVSQFDATALQHMSSLRELSLECVTLVPSAPLKVLRWLTALQSLCIADNSYGAWGKAALQTLPPADAAALTASAQLTSLKVPGLINVLTPSHYVSMFPVDRTLPNLLELRVGTELLEAAAVWGAACSCVNLTSLMVTRHSDEGAEEGARMPDTVAAPMGQGLQQLTRFSKLLALYLQASQEQLPRKVWSGLAAVTGLRSLGVDSWRPNYGYALALSKLRALTELNIAGSNHIQNTSFECDVFLKSKAPAGSDPDVWQQLPSAFFKAAGFQLLRAGMDDEYEYCMDFLQSQAAAGEVVVQQLKERDQQLRAAEARNQQLQQELLQAQQQLAALGPSSGPNDS